MLKIQWQLLVSYYHIPFITIPRLKCWVRLFCQESIPFTYFKAKFPQWMIYFSFKEWTFATTIFNCTFNFYFLAYTPTLTCAKKSNNIWFVYSEKVTEMFSLNNITFFLIWHVYFTFKDGLEQRTSKFWPESVSIQ